MEVDDISYLENVEEIVEQTEEIVEQTENIEYMESVDCVNNVNCVELSTLFKQKSLIELGKSSWHPAERCNDNIKIFETQTYSRGCKWSPDGTCCLTVINNAGTHVIELPRDLYNVSAVNCDRSLDILDSIIQVQECGLIYDFCWYPGMNSMIPESCCWLTTRKNAPVQMWDAFDGALRCSYRGYNAVDEVEAAISVCFSNRGDQIHAGYKKCIKTFDVDRPGREYINQPIAGTASSIAVSPTQELIAVGSWKADISLYNIQEGKTKSLGKMRSHSGGVTHIMFTPDGMNLVTGARKDSQLNIWDIRLYRTPLKTLHRKVETNQRIYFDISKCGKYLVTGNTDGIAQVWNLQDEIKKDEDYKSEDIKYQLHNDCCNGISIHPYRPILATSSGQHHISNNICNDDDSVSLNDTSSSMNNVCDNDSIDKNNSFSLDFMKQSVENSLEFWWTGDIE